MRLRQVRKEYEGRVLVRTRAFPLELLRGEAPPRDILEQEWWVAAAQEGAAAFAPYPADDWPATTLPAFDAAWAASQQGPDVAFDYEVHVRRAFFAEGRNIGRPHVLIDVARETGLEMAKFERDVTLPAARAAVLEESRIGRERYHVHGTPTLMLGDGTRLHLPIAFPKLRNRRIVAMAPVPCAGDDCLQMTRGLFDRALASAHGEEVTPAPGP